MWVRLLYNQLQSNICRPKPWQISIIPKSCRVMDSEACYWIANAFFALLLSKAVVNVHYVFAAINLPSRYLLSHDGANLTISNVNTNDFMVVTCMATNIYGSSTAQGSLSVLREFKTDFIKLLSIGKKIAFTSPIARMSHKCHRDRFSMRLIICKHESQPGNWKDMRSLAKTDWLNELFFLVIVNDADTVRRTSLARLLVQESK